jgi:hypothetical protein
MTALGLSQSTARKIAREVGGVATQARLSPSTGRWIIGGWANRYTVWIVTDLAGTEVLADQEVSAGTLGPARGKEGNE